MSFASELRQVQPAPSREPVTAVPPRRTAALPSAATAHPFAKSFTCAVLAYIVATAILLGFALPAAADGPATVRALGIFAVASFVPALITGMMACQSRRAWPFWRIALVFLPMFSLVAILHASGAAAV